MSDFDDSPDDSEVDERQEQEIPEAELDALDALENTEPATGEKAHLVPAHILDEVDKTIAEYRSVEDSRLDEGKDYPRDAVRYIMKGDAGEGYTYVRLLERYERDRIVTQPRIADASGGGTSRILPCVAQMSPSSTMRL